MRGRQAQNVPSRAGDDRRPDLRAFDVRWLAVTGAIVELCAREVARRSLVEHLTGHAPGAPALVIVTAVAAMALAADGARHPRRRTALVFAWLFAIGLAFQLQLGARLQSDGFYYFSYLRSLAFDRDFDFTNDYTLLGLGDKPHLFRPPRRPATPTRPLRLVRRSSGRRSSRPRT